MRQQFLLVSRNRRSDNRGKEKSTDKEHCGKLNVRDNVVVVEEPRATNDRTPSEDEKNDDGRELTPVTAKEEGCTIEGAEENSNAAKEGDEHADLVVGAPDLGDLVVDDAADSDKGNGKDEEDDVEDGLHDGLLDECLRKCRTY